MKAPGLPLWELRDNRTLGAYAKLAYAMLWSRQPDVRPSLQTLAADMGVSKQTACRALDELEAAGLVKRIRRDDERSGHLATRYILEPLPTPCSSQEQGLFPEGPTPCSSGGPEDSKFKSSSEGSKTGRLTGSRSTRERAEPSDEQIITGIRAAIGDYFGERESVIVTDEEVLDLYAIFIEAAGKPVHSIRKYMLGIFDRGGTPNLDAYLSKSPPYCTWCDTDRGACTCAA